MAGVRTIGPKEGVALHCVRPGWAQPFPRTGGVPNAMHKIQRARGARLSVVESVLAIMTERQESGFESYILRVYKAVDSTSRWLWLIADLLQR
jgi:hypothetical protein